MIAANLVFSLYNYGIEKQGNHFPSKKSMKHRRKSDEKRDRKHQPAYSSISEAFISLLSILNSIFLAGAHSCFFQMEKCKHYYGYPTASKSKLLFPIAPEWNEWRLNDIMNIFTTQSTKGKLQLERNNDSIINSTVNFLLTSLMRICWSSCSAAVRGAGAE